MRIIIVIIVVIIIVVAVIIIISRVILSVLRNACLTLRNHNACLAHVADALHFRSIIMCVSVAPPGSPYDSAAGRVAGARNITLLKVC